MTNKATAWIQRRAITLIAVIAGGLRTAVAVHQSQPERGDVPGWVLITLMTAGIVVVLMAVAGPTLQRIFLEAMAQVTG